MLSSSLIIPFGEERADCLLVNRLLLYSLSVGISLPPGDLVGCVL